MFNLDRLKAQAAETIILWPKNFAARAANRTPAIWIESAPQRLRLAPIALPMRQLDSQDDWRVVSDWTAID